MIHCPSLMALDSFPFLFSSCCGNSLNFCCSWPGMLAYALAYFCCGEVRLQFKGRGCASKWDPWDGIHWSFCCLTPWAVTHWVKLIFLPRTAFLCNITLNVWLPQNHGELKNAESLLLNFHYLLIYIVHMSHLMPVCGISILICRSKPRE